MEREPPDILRILLTLALLSPVPRMPREVQTLVWPNGRVGNP
jgi:hypothetical protein